VRAVAVGWDPAAMPLFEHLLPLDPLLLASSDQTNLAHHDRVGRSLA